MSWVKKDQLIGLDIGSRTLKICEMIPSKSSYQLKKFGTVDIPHGCIEEGAIKRQSDVADALRELFRSQSIREKNVAISIGGYSVIVKKITIDNMPDEQLHETIHFEAEQYIPYDISDINLDYQVLGTSDTNPNQMNVLLVAAKKDMVNEYVDLLRFAGLNPCIIDIDAFALQNIFEINYETGNENVALIDIGTCKTSLNIIKDRNSVFMRDVSLGCGQINEKIVTAANCSLEEAEDIKTSAHPKGISKEALREIISSVVLDWCNEIRRAIDFFYSTYPDDQIQRIILSGGGANIEQFRQLLGTETNADVEVINPFKKISIQSANFEPGYLDKWAPQSAICLGLGLRRINDK